MLKSSVTMSSRLERAVSFAYCYSLQGGPSVVLLFSFRSDTENFCTLAKIWSEKNCSSERTSKVTGHNTVCF